MYWLIRKDIAGGSEWDIITDKAAKKRPYEGGMWSRVKRLDTPSFEMAYKLAQAYLDMADYDPFTDWYYLPA